jgi:hypothetical protein
MTQTKSIKLCYDFYKRELFVYKKNSIKGLMIRFLFGSFFFVLCVFFCFCVFFLFFLSIFLSVLTTASHHSVPLCARDQSTLVGFLSPLA